MIKILSYISFFYLLICLYMYFFQTKFIFFPSKNIILTPKDVGLQYEDHLIPSTLGRKINAWYVPVENPIAYVIFCHGNGGNLNNRLDTLLILENLHLSTLIFDYQGYGKSEGKPSEENSYDDVQAAFSFLTKIKKIPQEKIILWGRSLGGAVACDLAKKHSPACLIMESTFSSITDMAKDIYPFLPVKLITRIQYNSLEKIKSISCPKLFIHSPTDDIIPFALGKKLFDNSPKPKRFLEISGDHNSGFQNSGDLYIDPIKEFLKDNFPPLEK